ncbi:MAG: polyketide synthase dehydratase domain-containing protein [Anaerolineales bacterium]|nr:polyketide synthase dehydratase domain-containing protein [Anaerolineales bacterium]
MARHPGCLSPQRKPSHSTEFPQELRADQGLLEYGPAFQGIGQIWCSGGEVLAQVDLPERVRSELSGYQLHPVLLDVAFQSVAAALRGRRSETSTVAYLPVALESLRVYRSPEQAVYAHAVLHPPQGGTPGRLSADVVLLDRDGQILVDAAGLSLAASGRAAELAVSDRRVLSLPGRLAITTIDRGCQPYAHSERWLIIDGAGVLGERSGDSCAPRGRACIVIHAPDAPDGRSQSSRQCSSGAPSLTRWMRPDQPFRLTAFLPLRRLHLPNPGRVRRRPQ